MDESLVKMLKEYEQSLKDNLFITGCEPSYEDAYLFKLLTEAGIRPPQKKYPSVWAWYSLMILFEDEVINEWLKKSGKEHHKKENKKENKKEKKNKEKKENAKEIKRQRTKDNVKEINKAIDKKQVNM